MILSEAFQTIKNHNAIAALACEKFKKTHSMWGWRVLELEIGVDNVLVTLHNELSDQDTTLILTEEDLDGLHP